MNKYVIGDTDAYKFTHWKQSRGFTKLYSYAEPRVGGKYPFICFFGIRMIIADHLLQEVDDKMIKRMANRSNLTFGTDKYFNYEVWEKVAKLGYIPVVIKAVPEGTPLEINNVAFTIESTEDWFADSVNVLEGSLLHTWYPTTTSTRAMYIKKSIKPFFDKSSEIADVMLPFAVNDFGYRGATCHEAAARGGAGFLVHFAGSDNIPAMMALEDYYACSDRLKSVWATEHSVATSYGLSPDNEKEYLRNQLLRSDPNLIVSVVIDSKNSDNFIKEIVGDLEISQLIKNRPGRVVFRPDTGDPQRNVLKYLDMLGGIFGYHINNMGIGYKVLDSNVGLIQGDAMDENSIPALYKEVAKLGWAADNVVTGSGGGLLQEGITRDTSRWALKASYAEKDGNPIIIQKKPETDLTKTSKPGKLKLTPTGSGFMTMSSAEMPQAEFNSYVDRLEVVYENGKLYQEYFSNIIKRADKWDQK